MRPDRRSSDDAVGKGTLARHAAGNSAAGCWIIAAGRDFGSGAGARIGAYGASELMIRRSAISARSGDPSK